MKIFTAFVCAFALTSTPAIAETLTHDGVTYVYSVEQGKNSRTIVGQDVTNRRPFTLLVKNGWVSGTVDRQKVSFSLRDVKPLSQQSDSAVLASAN